jgi:hypothetical protein
MFKTCFQLLLATAIAMLSACGGDSGGYGYYAQPSYGSIAINQNSGAAAITNNYSTPYSANYEALRRCGYSCTTVLEYGSFMCGALATSDNLTFGWASNAIRSIAESNALYGCISRGGYRCQVVLSSCNDS